MVQRQVLPPRHKRQFQHDEVRGGTRGRVGSRATIGSPPVHSGRSTIPLTLAVSNWVADHRVRLIEDFPAKSPDLNTIEYVWGWMKRSIATHEPHDYDTLEAAIFSAWQDLTQITIRHFIDHVTTVMKEIIAANGGHSHWRPSMADCVIGEQRTSFRTKERCGCVLFAFV